MKYKQLIPFPMRITTTLDNCYASMYPVGLQGAVHSRQVHQLKQDTHVGCGLLTLFNITDITNSFAEPHFKATRWVLGELLNFNTANWLAFPLKYNSFDKYNTSTTKKRTLNCRVWVNKINNDIHIALIPLGKV